MLCPATRSPRRCFSGRWGSKLVAGCLEQEIVYQRDLLYMVHQGFLTPPVGYRIMTDSDISQAAAAQGDFRETEVQTQQESCR